MRIISSFTDFYEYDCYRYGEPDTSLTWVRDSISHRYNRNNSFLTNIIRNKFLSGNATDAIATDKKSWNKIDIVINEHIVGIYPVIYWFPIIKWRIGFVTHEMSIEDSIKCLTIKNYWLDCFKKYNIPTKGVFIPKQILNAGKNMKSFRGDGRNITDKFIEENPTIFDNELIESPLFYMEIDRLTWRDDNITIITNPQLNYETNILSAYPDEIYSRDIYNDIENYLWMKKQEPIVEPDNLTKILSHGFDKKTSFRKM